MGRPVPNPFEDDRRVLSIAELQAREDVEARAASRRRRASCGYVELHAHSGFSFLDGASQPEELVARAAELGYGALALTDHDNLCGALAFAHAARAHGVR